MRRKPSTLFAPYRTMGVVCSAVKPVLRVCSYSNKYKMTSLIVAIDNQVIHYNATKLRTVAASDTLPENITAIAADAQYVYASAGTTVYCLRFCRNLERSFDVKEAVKHMMILGENLIIVDVLDGIRVFELETGEPSIHLEGSPQFVVTSLMHPATYMNKILIGSSEGSLRLVNIRTGKVVHEFSKCMDAAVLTAEQSPAVDVIAFGLANGHVVIHNIREDQRVCSFRHDHAITAVGFRNDGEPFMSTADEIGHIAVWDLEKRELVGKNTKSHIGPVTQLYFMPGEPIMISTSADNSIRTWALDGPDGMPRQLNILEGHAEPVSAVKFCSKQEVLSSGFDGSVRKYSVANATARQKLGSAGIMSRAAAKKKKKSIESIRLEPVIDVAIGWTRESAWDNILCRHRDTLLVTTWTSRKNSQGTHKLVHTRFTTDATLFNASATSVCLSPCGNFAFIGYSSGHVDQFNVQSGRFIKSFVEVRTKKELDEQQLSKNNKLKEYKAHKAAVTALSVDSRGHELISASASGEVKFWQIRTGACLSLMRTSMLIQSCCQSPTSSLIAFVCKSAIEGKGASVAVVDTLCRRVVRNFTSVGDLVNCAAFSADGRWLLTANDNYIKVWELSTSKLIDVVLFDRPCIGISFNDSGEYMATVHEDERAIHIWANKTLFASHISIVALPLDYIPAWNDASVAALGVNTCSLDDSDEDEDSDMEEELAGKLHDSLVTYSGMAPSRWSNLTDIALIKERNKPVEAPKKPKQAPFFLSGVTTLDGFEFDVPSMDDEKENRKTLQAKRSMLELESSFSTTLRNASSPAALITVFSLLKKMSVSAIDFQLRSLSTDVLPNFFNMILEVLKTRQDFELAQAYMAAAIKIHRAVLWSAQEDENEDELSTVLEKLSLEEESVWDAFDEVITDNAAVVQWVKNALL